MDALLESCFCSLYWATLHSPPPEYGRTMQRSAPHTRFPKLTLIRKRTILVKRTRMNLVFNLELPSPESAEAVLNRVKDCVLKLNRKPSSVSFVVRGSATATHRPCEDQCAVSSDYQSSDDHHRFPAQANPRSCLQPIDHKNVREPLLLNASASSSVRPDARTVETLVIADCTTPPAVIPLVTELLVNVRDLATRQLEHSVTLYKHEEVIQSFHRQPNLASMAPTPKAATSSSTAVLTLTTPTNPVGFNIPDCSSEPHVACDAEPRRFADLLPHLAACNESSLQETIQKDVAENSELKKSFVIVNPSAAAENLTDQELAESILVKLNISARVLRTCRVTFAGSPAFEVLLDESVSALVCSRFRAYGRELGLPSNLSLKMKRTLLLRFAMFRMFRTVENLQKTSSFSEVQVERGWFARIGEDRISPYAFLSSRVCLKSGLSVSVP